MIVSKIRVGFEMQITLKMFYLSPCSGDAFLVGPFQPALNSFDQHPQ